MNHMFFGYDMDRTMLRIGAMNMMAHGIGNPFIEYRDSLSDQNPDKGKYSPILANPPFKEVWTRIPCPRPAEGLQKRRRPSFFLGALSCGDASHGGAACIVPDGVLFPLRGAHNIRQELVDGNRLEVRSPCSGVFAVCGVSTAVLIFTKTGTAARQRMVLRHDLPTASRWTIQPGGGERYSGYRCKIP